MAKKLYSDGNTGKVAIFNPAVAAAFDNPRGNLGAVYFHSDLDYVSVAAVLDVNVTHTARNVGGTGSHGYATPQFSAGATGFNHNLGYVPFALIFVGGALLPANTQIQLVGQSFRTSGAYVTSSQVVIQDFAWVYGSNLPSMVKNYKIVLLTTPIAPSGTTTLSITPGRFIASRGKLDSIRNYLRRAPTNPMFWFSKGKTADVANGSFRVVTADGTFITRAGYNGTFQGVPGIGVEI